MSFKIDSPVQHMLPELEVKYVVIHNAQPVDLSVLNFHKLELGQNKLSRLEKHQYVVFRRKIAGRTKLAVERLQRLDESTLPKPRVVTNLIIRASYLTGLPITVFSTDHISSNVILRYSKPGEYIDLEKGRNTLEPGTLIASSGNNVLGIFGVKSAIHGKLKKHSKNMVLLSFGVSASTAKKAEGAVAILESMVINALHTTSQLPDEGPLKYTRSNHG